MQKNARFGAILLAVGLACGKGPSSGSGSGGPPPPPSAQTFTLSVTVHGNGTVTSTPAGIDCGTACAMSFPAGTVVTLTAAHSGGPAMPEWTGACSGPGSCSVTMNADAAVTVAFADTDPVKVPPAAQHTLTVSVSGSGTVTSNPAGINCGTACSAPFDEGAQVTLTAQPAAGFTFSGFSGACSGTSCAVSMPADQTVTAAFTAAPAADECAGLLPSALPAAIKAPLPQNECRGGTSDDGDGTFVLGYTAGEGPTFPEWLFFTIQNGQAVRTGDRILGGDESATFVYSQPSGFTVFSVFGLNDSSSLTSFDHAGNRLSSVALAQGRFDHEPSSQAAVDPSGGTATVRHVFDNASGTWGTFYKRFDKTGAPETGDILIDTQDRPVVGIGVVLSGHALVTVAQSPQAWLGRWIARDGSALTDWFSLPGTPPARQASSFLMDGSLAVGFHRPAPVVEAVGVTYQFVVQDGQASASALPAWLQARASDVFYVVRGGRAYAAWGAQGSCAPGAIEVLAASSGKSCGCLSVPSLAGDSSIGRDGSLMVSEPPVNFGTCVWDLYPHLFQ